jgi:hypothetical protein
MEERHLSEDELLDRLYGVSARSDSHFDACPECRCRWNVLCEARGAELARQQPAISEAVLVQQRMLVINAIKRRAARAWLPGPVPAFAMAMVCVVAVLISRPAPVPESSQISDAQFFAEAYKVAESTQPRSAAPIRYLFQGEPQQ